MIKSVNYDNIPQELKELNNWCAWTPILQNENKYEKTPVTLNNSEFRATNSLMYAKSNDSATWCDFEKAKELIEEANKKTAGKIFGLNFAVCFPYVIFDFDQCINENKEINKFVLDFIRQLNTYTEISNSNKGIHCIAKVSTHLENRSKNKELFDRVGTDIEIFTEKHFCCLTGDIYENKNTIEERTEEIQKFYEEYYSKKHKEKNITTSAENNHIGNELTVKEIIELASTKSKNKELFKKLFDGDFSDYPSQSEADSAFMFTLAFWCAKDKQKMDTIFKLSKLYREKYDEKHFSDGATYGEKLIEKACERVKAVFNPCPIQLEKGKITAKNLIKYFLSNFEFFQNCLKENFILLPDENSNSRIYNIKSREFTEYINLFLLDNFGAVASSNVLKDTINALIAHTSRCGEKNTYLRCGFYHNKIYYDLCNQDLQVVEISKNGYKITNDVPIFFERTAIEREQVKPSNDSNFNKLIPYLNIAEEDMLLFVVTLICAFIPNIPHPIFMIHGRMGSGKSTLCKILKELIDPSAADIRPLKKDEKDFRHSVLFEYFIPFDNLSNINLDTSDALCRLVTGETQIDRELFTNTGTFVYSLQKVLAINGITDLARSPDLIDRSIIFTLPTISTEKRQMISDFQERFKKDKEDILAGIFDIISRAMSIYNNTARIKNLPRMADFAQWGYCIAEAYNNSGDEFLERYNQHINYQYDLLANNDTILMAIVRFAECYKDKEICISVQSFYYILVHLIEAENLFNISKTYFPKDAGALTKKIKRNITLLEEKGLNIESIHNRDGNYIKITKVSDFPFTPSPFLDIEGILTGNTRLFDM